MNFRSTLALFGLAIAFAVVVPVLIVQQLDGVAPADATQSRLKDNPNNTKRSGGSGTVGGPTYATVRLVDGKAIPRIVEITRGGRIAFTNKADPTQGLRFVTPGAPGAIKDMFTDRVVERTFVETGTYRYVSTVDPRLRGSVVVH